MISALIAREESAFYYAIKTFQPSMRSLARSIAGEKIADEVVQEAWLSAMGAIGRFEGRSALKTWLLRIVANEAKTRLRKENRTVSLEALSGDEDPFERRFAGDGSWAPDGRPGVWEDSPDEMLSTRELADCMERTLARLPDMQSATLRLREQQGYSLHEICNILEVSESNVRVLLHRARTRLFETVEHFQATGECRTG
ncbi:MAG: sigma-70 family RNA polymerase sigma factor [Gammaproteobacteria bacterium]|nr:sigma-70 family RNA polymerase sigma factor [Gammaproteobacteria bacterium]